MNRTYPGLVGPHGRGARLRGVRAWLAQRLVRAAPAGQACHIRMVRSRNGGASRGKPLRPYRGRSETEHGVVALVPWNAGAVALWLDGRKTVAGGPMTLRDTTIGQSGAVAPDLEVDDRVCDCWQTDMTRTARGLIAVYRDRDEGEGRHIAARRYGRGAWSARHADGARIGGFSRLAIAGHATVMAWTQPGPEGGVRATTLRRAS